jgi:hypothetical protein
MKPTLAKARLKAKASKGRLKFVIHDLRLENTR